jgi:hypothetical protein
VVIATQTPVRGVTSSVAFVAYRQTPSVIAVSFAARSDESLKDEVFTLDWASDVRPAAKVSSATCFDRLGNAIAGAAVHLP